MRSFTSLGDHRARCLRRLPGFFGFRPRYRLSPFQHPDLFFNLCHFNQEAIPLLRKGYDSAKIGRTDVENAHTPQAKGIAPLIKVIPRCLYSKKSKEPLDGLTDANQIQKLWNPPSSRKNKQHNCPTNCRQLMRSLVGQSPPDPLMSLHALPDYQGIELEKRRTTRSISELTRKPSTGSMTELNRPAAMLRKLSATY